MTPARPRSPEQRKRDALDRLELDTDAWVATADGGSGTPYLVPLSFLWHGGTLPIAAPSSGPTARNPRAIGKVRLGIGPTRDLGLVEGTARPLAATEVPTEGGDAFAAKTGFDPRRLATASLVVRIHPRRIQAWREADELEGRELMGDGQWLVA